MDPRRHYGCGFAQVNQTGAYSVRVSNAFGSLTSPGATLSVGLVAAWGSNSGGKTDVPAGLTNVTQIAAGSSHSLALNADGTVVAWGNNLSGQTTVPPGLTNGIAVAATS